MSLASDIRAAVRAETIDELQRMAAGETMMGAIAREELARRERESAT